MIPYKIPLERFGVALIRRDSKNLSPVLNVNGDNSSDPGKYVGFEYETDFTESPVKLRRLVSYLESYDLLSPYSNPSRETVLMDIRKIIQQCSNVFMGNVILDTGNLEYRSYPSTLKAHLNLKDEYERVTKFISSFEFSITGTGAGIHITMDKGLFGKDRHSQRKSFVNFLWTLYNCRDFIVKVSCRKDGDEKLADIYSLLGDSLSRLPEDSLRERFIEDKTDLLDCFTGGTSKKRLNIHVNKHNSDLTEFKWFGTTENINNLMAMIEFGYALPQFSKETTEEKTYIHHLFSFLEKTKKDYVHLYNLFKHVYANSKNIKIIA